GRDLRDAGDRRELFLERRGDRSRHRRRVRARQRGRDLNRRIVDRRQIAHGQRSIAHDAEDDDRELDEGRRDRTANEQRREIHGRVPRAASAPAVLIWILAPGVSPSCPSVTTRSPTLSPLSTTMSSPFRSDVWTGRNATV